MGGCTARICSRQAVTSWSPDTYPAEEGKRAGLAHVVSLYEPVSAEVAAFTNAAIAHSVIRDDMHLQAGAHIGVMVIPAALALAERDGWDADQLLKGVVGGYEMAAFLGAALRSSKSSNEHFRPSGIIGAFGAAGAAIAGAAQRDPRVTTDVAANALGLAANMGSGFNEWAWAGGSEIITQMGSAARGGLFSFDLAVAGIESSATALEGRSGLFAAHALAGGAHVAALQFETQLSKSGIGAGITGARFKPYAGCNFVQTPIATASVLSKTIVERGQAVEDIVGVIIVTSTAARKYPGCNFQGPFQTVQQSKMSLQYAVSAAISFRGQMSEESYVQFQNETLQHLIEACAAEADSAYAVALSKEGKQPCRITVQTRDGTEYTEALDDVPWLGADAVKDRCKTELGKRFDAATARRIFDAVYSLALGKSQCIPADVCELLAKLK